MGNYNKGDRVELSTYPNEEDVYFSILDAIFPDNQVMVFMPITQGHFVKLAPNCSYYVSFISNVDFSMLRFKADIVNYSRKGEFYFIMFKLKGKGERIERRSFYRYDYESPFVFYKIGETDDIGLDLNIYYDGLLHDISGGGIRFSANEEVAVNSYLSCLITLGRDQLITNGLVVHRRDTPKSSFNYEYRAKFDNDPVNQDKIVQFIFDQQRKVNKKQPRG